MIIILMIISTPEIRLNSMWLIITDYSEIELWSSNVRSEIIKFINNKKVLELIKLYFYSKGCIGELQKKVPTVKECYDKFDKNNPSNTYTCLQEVICIDLIYFINVASNFSNCFFFCCCRKWSRSQTAKRWTSAYRNQLESSAKI